MIRGTTQTTIAAIATPPGEGGVAIIRLSGPQSVEVGNRLFSKKLDALTTHTIHFGRVKDKQGEVIDDVLLLLMRAPRTFTGEDVVEIHCHGGTLISKKILERALEEGAQMAAPGEFSQRAFLNGKIDLTRAEAIQSLISAKNNFALKAAQSHLQGALHQKIVKFKNQLTAIAAIFEAWVDFPEEGLEFASEAEVLGELGETSKEMRALLETAKEGRLILDGIQIALIGAPNVGKSSLMNALLEKERAIVSPHAGTTRDTVEEHFKIGGLHVILTDTAGIREVGEEVEQEGIRRSKAALEKADLLFFLVDGERGWTDEEKDILPLLPEEKTLLIWNKVDRPHISPPTHAIKISAKEGFGIEALKKAVQQKVFEGKGPSEEGLLLTEMRHREALQEGVVLLEKVIEGLTSGVSPEFLVFDLRSSLKALGKIIGSDLQEDILNAIFSRFCIGK
jgi:tRNA modification GTPase